MRPSDEAADNRHRLLPDAQATLNSQCSMDFVSSKGINLALVAVISGAREHLVPPRGRHSVQTTLPPLNPDVPIIPTPAAFSCHISYMRLYA